MSTTAGNYRFKEEVGFLSTRRMYSAETEVKSGQSSARQSAKWALAYPFPYTEVVYRQIPRERRDNHDLHYRRYLRAQLNRVLAEPDIYLCYTDSFKESIVNLIHDVTNFFLLSHL